MSIVIRRCGHVLACVGTGVLWGVDKVSRMTDAPGELPTGYEDEEENDLYS